MLLIMVCNSLYLYDGIPECIRAITPRCFTDQKCALAVFALLNWMIPRINDSVMMNRIESKAMVEGGEAAHT